MRELFYPDPMKAAWMTQTWGLHVYTRRMSSKPSPRGRTSGYYRPATLAAHADPKCRPAASDGRYLLDERDHPFFEPMVGDLVEYYYIFVGYIQAIREGVYFINETHEPPEFDTEKALENMTMVERSHINAILSRTRRDDGARVAVFQPEETA